MSVLVLPTFGAVNVAQCRRTTEGVGDFDRAFDLSLRSDTRGTVRTWRVVTVEYAHAEAAAIEAELVMGALAVTLFGAAVTVYPRDVEVTYIGVAHAAVSCTLHEDA
jgi:hypothetical protein